MEIEHALIYCLMALDFAVLTIALSILAIRGKPCLNCTCLDINKKGR